MSPEARVLAFAERAAQVAEEIANLAHGHYGENNGDDLDVMDALEVIERRARELRLEAHRAADALQAALRGEGE